MWALDLNANRGRFGYEAQPRMGVSADKLPFSDSDKQANCLSECDRCNKPTYKKKEGGAQQPLGSSPLYFLIIIMRKVAKKKRRAVALLNYSDPCCQLDQSPSLE